MRRIFAHRYMGAILLSLVFIALPVLTASTPPSITTQPSSRTVLAGQTAAFSVGATGSAPLKYQWKKNGAAINGATSASYTTPATTTADSGAQFTVVVTNAIGTITSSAATLTVNAVIAPYISTQPVGQSATTGQAATFSVVATGTDPLKYQWKKNGKSISGATSASYTTPATTNSDNGSQFAVTVSNSAGSVTSNVAALVVIPPSPPLITLQPLEQVVPLGQSATFSIAATGTAPLTYQWSRNGVAIMGATSASYTTPATMSVDSGSVFRVLVRNATGSVNSNAAILMVTVPGPLSSSISIANFGNVNLGSASNAQVQITNFGTASVALSNVLVSGPGYSVSGISAGAILLPGQSPTMTVTFAPAATGLVAGGVTITSNAVNSPTPISFSGTGIQVSSHAVDLGWDYSTSPVASFNVYRAGITGGPYNLLNSGAISGTQYWDLTVVSGQTYYYVVTSVGFYGTESANSSEVSAVIPTP